jgi:hypothetical protein
MVRNLTVAIFWDAEVGYIAVSAAAPGLSANGNTPDAATSEFVSRFFAPFDDIPRPPVPETPFVCFQHIGVSISFTDHF